MLDNSIMTISPYMHEGMWVFDDDSVDLVKEPFVAGIPEMINVLISDIDDAKDGFNLIFSSDPFPGYDIRLNRRSTEYDGTWYQLDNTGMTGWLCPALFKYFDDAPKHIYVQAKQKSI